MLKDGKTLHYVSLWNASLEFGLVRERLTGIKLRRAPERALWTFEGTKVRDSAGLSSMKEFLEKPSENWNFRFGKHSIESGFHELAHKLLLFAGATLEDCSIRKTDRKPSKFCFPSEKNSRLFLNMKEMKRTAGPKVLLILILFFYREVIKK